MMATTHQLIALALALWWLTIQPVSLGPLLGAAAIVAVMVGALTPDLDQPTANLWRRVLGGRAVGNIFQAFSGGHRHLTHSIIGITAIGWGMYWAITHVIHPEYQLSAQAIWGAFMIGYISHPIADTFTDLGVPWFWPLHIQIRIPPGTRVARVTTGSLVERLVLRGALVVGIGLLLQANWPTMIHFFTRP